MRRTWKNFLSLLLVFAMILSLGATGFALEEENEVTAPTEETTEEPGSTGVELSFEKVDNDIISERLPFAHEPMEEEEPVYADDEYVRVSIVLLGASAIDAGYTPANAGAYRAGLKADQQAMAQKISAEALGGADLDVVWNLTLGANIISANVEYGQIEDIRNVVGVKDVVIETRYYPTEDEVQNITATEMTGATEAWNLGYTGAGSKIAIVDTGLDIEHQSFDDGAFEYAIDELNETRETPVVLMTEADVAAVWDQLNAATFIGSYDGVYRGAKVPFGVNYVDQDLDITHINDAQGEHGSHVAGIASANKYIPSGDGYAPALEVVKTQGEAPDAQLLIMKVFGKGGGAYDSDYMAAIEDAMTLGCDTVNLSLGSSVAGYTTNNTYLETLDKLTQFGLVWANSAGNNYSWTHFSTGDHYLYADDVNYQTGGSPATYHNTLSVASVDNKGQVGYTITASDGTEIAYNENTDYGNGPLREIAGEYDFIMLTRAGAEEEDFGALGSEILEGKVAIAWRGGSSFYVKANAAIANGAVATIVANNQAGVIGMNLTGYEYSAPAVSILQNDGFLLMNQGEVKEANGVTYYEGKLTINAELSATNVGTPTSEFQTMSSFSSWGGNGGLTMKPEITAPGGNIWSVWGANNGSSSPTAAHDQYEIMSGTSMASPQVAGVTAVLKQYIRETGLMEKFPGLTERAVAQSLLMSTAMPLREAATGNYWSIMKQGAGLVDVNAAINARSLIQIVGLPASAPESAYASIADGKVKVEAGEVNNYVYTAFTVTNFSDEDMALYLNGEFFTQWIKDEAFRTEYTVPVFAHINWTVNGEDYKPADLALDFNGDGVSNGLDAQRLLDWCADDTVEIYNLEYADLDGDGNVDTADAKIAFETLNGASVELAAGETAVITASISYDLSAYDEFNGNYIEGFLFVREGDTNDGALGVTHSIPVFGFNGNFSDATMFDRGSRLEYKYEFGDAEMWAPYLYYVDPSQGGLGEDALDVETFLVQYAGDSGNYYFGGNPMIDDESYHPERNALNAGDVLAGVRYTQIRNAGASRFFVTDKYDRTVPGTELEGGASYATYYYQNQSAWQQTTTTTGFNYIPRNVKEGDELTAHFQLALEYYVNSDGSVRWDALGKGSELSIPFVIDNTAPDIVKVYRNTNEEPEPDDFELPVNGTVAQPNEDDTPIITDPDPEPTEEPVEEEEAAVDTLEIITHDNQYIAAVAVFTDEGELLDAKGAVEDTIRGKEVYYSFDLKEIFGEEEVYPYLLVQVYDYAANLSTYKVNFVDDLETAEVESVTVDPAEATIIGTGTIRLSADVRPWGIDDAVEWTSSDETVATVDDKGVVTGVAEGTATITATSLLDPTKSGTCEVTVKFIDKPLSGIVWDENGEVWFADFNLNSLPEYSKLNASNLRLQLSSAAYDENGVLYAADLDSSDLVSTLYTVNTADWSVEPIGASSIGYMDLCQAPSLGSNHMLAVYGPYVVIVNKETGDYDGVFNLASSTGNQPLVGIAYEEQFNHPSYGNTDWVFLLDKAGNIYSTGFLPYGGSYTRFGVSKIGQIGAGVDLDYWQSLYYDGDSLFWSRFNMASNKVEIVMVDHLYTDGSIYTVGGFADGVWPVGGIFENGLNPYFGPVEPNDHSDAVVDPNAEFLVRIPGTEPDAEINEEEPVEEPVVDEEPVEEPAPIEEPVGGGLDFARVELPGDAEQEKVETEVVVYITADELTYNGKIEINFDPTTVKLIEAIPAAQYTAVLDRTDDLGRYVLAWVDLNGIETDGVILTLKFTTDSVGTVTITTHEENFKDSDVEEANLPREELVFLGSTAIPEDHEHAYELAHWNWAEDFSAAVAVFACPQDGASKSYEAVVTSETTDPTCTEAGKIVYTATVEVDGETYTDVKEVEIEALGHEYGEPTWTWTEDFTATATFACVRGDDEQVVEATVTSETTEPTCEEAGETVYTATVEFEGETYTDTKTAPIEALGHDWDEPTWTWEGYTAATAEFVCARNEEHTTTVEAEIASVTNEDNTITFTATVELEGETYIDEKTAPVGANVYGSTLVIGEKFAAKGYLFLAPEVLADQDAYATVNGTKVLVKDAGKLKVSGKYAYSFDFNLGPKMFNDEIVIKLYNGADEELVILDKDGKYLPDGFIFTGQEYIDKVIAANSNEKLVNTMIALNDMGHYAQVYYKYNTENVAELLGDVSSVTEEDLADYAGKVIKADETVIKYVGSTMLLQNEMKIRQYFTLGEGVELSDLTFKINGSKVTAVEKNGMVYIESKNVPAKNLDVAYKFVVTDRTGAVVYSGEYSAFSYALSTLKNSSDADLANLVKSMVLYNQAAKIYFAK
jgi:lactocepin